METLSPASRAEPLPTWAAPVALAARADHATKRYGRGDNHVLALDDVTVGLRAGCFTAIMGPSGSGKSTLMHCLAGLDSLTSGKVFLGDVELGTLSDRELTRVRRERIGFVFQAFNLLPTLNAIENITLPMSLAGRRPNKEWLRTVVEVVGLEQRLEHRPSELSGGQQQRVAVARALASMPTLIFADEPTGNLDSRSGGEILTFMRTAVDDLGQTIVMVTHDAVAASHADTVLFLEDGRIVDSMATPTPDRILDRMKQFGEPREPSTERTIVVGEPREPSTERTIVDGEPRESSTERTIVCGSDTDMFNVTLSGLWARKRRLIGTSLAVVLGVAFLAATLVLGDTMRAGFEQAFTDANAGTDVVVRSADKIGSGDSLVRGAIDAVARRRDRRRPGVRAAEPSVEGVAHHRRRRRRPDRRRRSADRRHQLDRRPRPQPLPPRRGPRPGGAGRDRDRPRRGRARRPPRRRHDDRPDAEAGRRHRRRHRHVR